MLFLIRQLVELSIQEQKSSKVQGIFGCGLARVKSHCEMTGINFLNDKGEILRTINVTPGVYDQITRTTQLQLLNNFQVKNSLSSSDQVKINFTQWMIMRMVYNLQTKVLLFILH